MRISKGWNALIVGGGIGALLSIAGLQATERPIRFFLVALGLNLLANFNADHR